MECAGRIIDNHLFYKMTDKDGNMLTIQWMPDNKQYILMYNFKEEKQFIYFEEDELQFLLESLKLFSVNRNI